MQLLLLLSFSIAQMCVVGFFFLSRKFFFGASDPRGFVRLAQLSVLLAGFAVITLCVLRKHMRNGMIYVAVYCFVCLPLTFPIFWYPLRFSDRKALAQEEFGRWFRTAGNASGVLVVQDLNGRLAEFCGITDVNFVWLYAGMFADALRRAPVGTLVVFETDSAGVPRAR
jgi:hypothetical protein